MEQIKSIIDKALYELKDFIILDENEIIETYYNIYLTSLGIRNGTYVEIHDFDMERKLIEKFNMKNENDYIDFISNVFKGLKEIKNIDFYIGKLYDASRFRDTLYVYYKPRKNKLFKIINFIEKIDRYNEKTRNILNYKIALLLSYEPIKNYLDVWDNLISVDFTLTDGSKLSIISYWILPTEKMLMNTYKKLVKINKGLKLINKRCILQIIDEPP